MKNLNSSMKNQKKFEFSEIKNIINKDISYLSSESLQNVLDVE